MVVVFHVFFSALLVSFFSLPQSSSMMNQGGIGGGNGMPMQSMMPNAPMPMGNIPSVPLNLNIMGGRRGGGGPGHGKTPPIPLLPPSLSIVYPSFHIFHKMFPLFILMVFVHCLCMSVIYGCLLDLKRMFEPEFVLSLYAIYVLFYLFPIPFIYLYPIIMCFIYFIYRPPLKYLPPVPKNKPLKLTGVFFFFFLFFFHIHVYVMLVFFLSLLFNTLLSPPLKRHCFLCG